MAQSLSLAQPMFLLFPQTSNNLATNGVPMVRNPPINSQFQTTNGTIRYRPPKSTANSSAPICAAPIYMQTGDPLIFLKVLPAPTTPQICMPPFRLNNDAMTPNSNIKLIQTKPRPGKTGETPKIVTNSLLNASIPNIIGIPPMKPPEKTFTGRYKNMFNYERYAKDGKLSKLSSTIRETVQPVVAKWPCMICDDEKHTKDSLIEYYEAHKREMDASEDSTGSISSFECPACDSKFISRSAYTNHAESKHRPKEFLCATCKTACTDAYAISLHMAQHQFRTDQLRCCVCKSFKTQSEEQLREHIHVEHEKNTLQRCDECGKDFSSDVWFQDHRLFHLPKDRMYCAPCDRHFDNHRLILRHNKRYHNQPTPGLGKHQCHICHLTFPFESNRLCHIKYYHSDAPLACTVCDKSYKTKKLLKSHMQTHVAPKRFVCSYCGKTFGASNMFRNHVNIHTGEKPHMCPHCGRCFTQRSAMVTHMRYKHTGERPHQCAKCDRRFVTKKSKTNHQAVCKGKD